MKLAAAERHFQDGLTLENDHPGILVRLGLFYLAHARSSEAVAPLEAYHRLQPQNAPGCLILSQAYAATNEREKARELLMKGERLAEQSGNVTLAQRCREIQRQL